MGTKPATFLYLRVLKTDQLSLLSWASSSSWNTGVCSGSFESLSFHSKITASVQKPSNNKGRFPVEILQLFMHLASVYCVWDIPSPPEASSSPFGLKRTTLTALVCLARLDRNSTTAFPSPSVSTRHNCSKQIHILYHTTNGSEKYISFNTCFPHKSKEIRFLNAQSWSKSPIHTVSLRCRLCSHSLWLPCPLQPWPADEGVHQSRAGSPGCKLVPYCAKQSHTLPPSCWVVHDLKRTTVKWILLT